MDYSEDSQYDPNYNDSVTSTSSLIFPSVPPPRPYEERRTFNIGRFWEVSLFWSNVLFAFVATAGQVGEDVTIPLWLNSTRGGKSSTPAVDSYFVLSFTSLSFIVIFGISLLLIRIFWPRDLGDNERTFPHLLLFPVGLCNALSGVLTVYASSSLRTPLYLQAILNIFIVPSTILLR